MVACPDGPFRSASLFRNQNICPLNRASAQKTFCYRWCHQVPLYPAPAELSYPPRSIRSFDRARIVLSLGSTFHAPVPPGSETRQPWPGKGLATPTKATVVPALQRFATAVTHAVNRRSSVVARSRCARDVLPKASPASTVCPVAMASGHDLSRSTLHCFTEDHQATILRTTLTISTSRSITRTRLCSLTRTRSIAHQPQEKTLPPRIILSHMLSTISTRQ
jgi:hypothetical protein